MTLPVLRLQGLLAKPSPDADRLRIKARQTMYWHLVGIVCCSSLPGCCQQQQILCQLTPGDTDLGVYVASCQSAAFKEQGCSRNKELLNTKISYCNDATGPVSIFCGKTYSAAYSLCETAARPEILRQYFSTRLGITKAQKCGCTPCPLVCHRSGPRAVGQLASQ